MDFSFLIVSDTARPDFFKPREIVNKGRLDVIARFILSSIEGNTLRKPVNILVALLGDKEKQIIYTLNENIFSKNITEPLIAKKISQIMKNELRVQQEQISANTWKQIKNNYNLVLLATEGKQYFQLKKEINEKSMKKEILFIFGAQNDVPNIVLNNLCPHYLLTLGKKQYLASQASTILRYILTIQPIN